MKNYLYKNIKPVLIWGTWGANYEDGKISLNLHRFCCKTKKEAYELAKIEVDWLNGKEI